MPVAGHLVRPTRGSNEAGRLLPFYLVLHRVGFTELPPSPAALVSSYLAFSPLPSAVTRVLGGVFSVALSLESLPLGVTQHPAPWSSDFPQASRRTPATVCPPRSRISHLKIHPNTETCNPRGARREAERSGAPGSRTPRRAPLHNIIRLAVELGVRELVGDRVLLAADVRDRHAVKRLHPLARFLEKRNEHGVFDFV